MTILREDVTYTKIRSIQELSKDELLNLIYNNFDTLVKHPTMCAVCGGDGRAKILKSEIYPETSCLDCVKVLHFICDFCEGRKV